ncbi:6097_t:CDS:2 [Funneliformis geosporum]|uniref:14497_t:CDS:1 n=1 Tax=Funneliformis geosporum TaxID=1117311 RepID=A0A9W4WQU1_9GLOM|nr:14497_t:CDS:2 [Funneliformis geosporum]CAI2184309.1 6097_t:CDS:2 [Funneliformis geosporum]
MDKTVPENKENESSNPPKFMLPSISSISNLPNSPLNTFQQINKHESADSILRGSSSSQTTFPVKVSPLNARNIPPFNQKNNFGMSIKQESNTSTPNFYLPKPSITYDLMNSPYTTTYWPAYYSEYYQSNKNINGSIGPQYNISTWSANDNISIYNNSRQEYLRSSIPARPFASYLNDNKQLPSLTSNLHSILNSSPSSHHLSYNSAFTKVRRRSDLKDDLISNLESDNNLLEIEGIKVQRAIIKSQGDENSFTHENIDPVLLNIHMEETVKKKDYNGTPSSTPDTSCKIESSKDKKKSRSNWSRKETRSLITAVKSKHKLLLAAQRNAEKSRIWSDMFSDHCTRYSGRTLKAFKLRWARLVADYNSVHECIKTGVEPMDFDFYDEMKEIFGDDFVADSNIISTDITDECLVPVLKMLKRRLDENETSQTDTSEEYLEDQSLAPQSSLHSPSPPRFYEPNDEEASLVQLSKRIRVDKDVKTVLKEVEITQRKCEKIIEQLKDITK